MQSNISARELYRFATEELFNDQVNDMDMPGTMICFTYDEFYPGLYFDNTQAVIEECIKSILAKMPLELSPHFRKENLLLNNHISLTDDALKELVNRYKGAFDIIEIVELEATNCKVDKSQSRVYGNYKVGATSANETIHLSGNWGVDFEKDIELGYWYTYSVEINGINF